MVPVFNSVKNNEDWILLCSTFVVVVVVVAVVCWFGDAKQASQRRNAVKTLQIDSFHQLATVSISQPIHIIGSIRFYSLGLRVGHLYAHPPPVSSGRLLLRQDRRDDSPSPDKERERERETSASKWFTK